MPLPNKGRALAARPALPGQSVFHQLLPEIHLEPIPAHLWAEMLLPRVIIRTILCKCLHNGEHGMEHVAQAPIIDAEIVAVALEGGTPIGSAAALVAHTAVVCYADPSGRVGLGLQPAQ